MSAGPSGGVLRGRRVLVVEDEYMIADELAELMAGAGAEVVGPVATVAEALALVESGRPVDGAVLDVNLLGETVWPVAEALRARGVPMALLTGYDAGVVPPAFADVPLVQKPGGVPNLARLLARAAAGGGR